MYNIQGLSVFPSYERDGGQWMPALRAHHTRIPWDYGEETKGEAFYLLDTLPEVASVVEAWERESEAQFYRDKGFEWSYKVYARKSGRIILHVVYQEDPGMNA